MTHNIVETIQKMLGYPALQKVDPNSQEIKENFQRTTEEKLAQSILPVVLAGFYSYTRSDEGCNAILADAKNENWLDIIFGVEKQKAVEKVAQYAGVSNEEVLADMEQASREAAKLIREGGGEKPTPEKIKVFMNNQRHNILVHLPAALQLGELLHDNAMDDRTNKMEGPISSLMHTIENKLSGGGS